MSYTELVSTTHVHWHDSEVSKSDRHRLNGHSSCVLWFTGLSGAGKSTIANAVQRQLHHMKKRSYVLDGDNIRLGLNKGLGFSTEDRNENIRRVSEVAKLFVDAGLIAITAMISPFGDERKRARERFADGDFIEIFVSCPLSECEKRDPKGLYGKARAGVITSFTGISSPYEAPQQPELALDTSALSVEQATQKVIDYLLRKGII